MKRMKLIILILLIFANCKAPEWKSFVIAESKPIKPAERLIYAIGMVEGNCDTLAYNPVEKAVGYFQIRPIRLRDYNQRTGKNYKLKDMYNYSKAEEVFMYYFNKSGGKDFEMIARSWNGSGKMTKEYWKKVKVYL